MANNGVFKIKTPISPEDCKLFRNCSNLNKPSVPKTKVLSLVDRVSSTKNVDNVE
ncbi:MAG: hypothetical protein KKF68_01570 [Nanoarchaeota archaeon]|nr:hypothetical protein [Nanoarchaeota archaeon]